MRILAIETSCDDSAVSVVEARGRLPADRRSRSRLRFRTLSHLVSSQTKIHAHWGGVVPTLAKREHGKNLIPLLKQALRETKLIKNAKRKAKGEKRRTKNKNKAGKILEREPELRRQFFDFIPTTGRPKIDLIAVTYGPGLEPALWVGLNLAKALGLVWQKPVWPINHLEGHLLSPLAGNQPIKFPALALIVSGGHTELVLVKDWLKYKLIGQTRDDAAGEAFDKVARLLGFPYPGGPEIARLAELATTWRRDWPLRRRRSPKEPAKQLPVTLPRPMINSGDFDFSFSGLKTAVLYLVQKIPRNVLEGPQGGPLKAEIAAEFQQAVIDVLVSKFMCAAEYHRPRTLILCGGVAANQELRRQLTAAAQSRCPAAPLLLPLPALNTDNATMIGVAGYIRWLKKKVAPKRLSAAGQAKYN